MKHYFTLLSGLAIFAALAAQALRASPPTYPPVEPGRPLHFPRDHGAHPDYRTEWWYVTGWLHTDSGAPLGFQLTFFRSRPPLDEANPSHFAPKQLLFAHVALSDPSTGHLQYDQRGARIGFGLADAITADTAVSIDGWLLHRGVDGTYFATLTAQGFALELALQPTQAPLLQGESGYSRKGPRPEQASFYYSLPQLTVSGTVTRRGKPERINGTAWLDHEWASAPLAAEATGWDWVGLNLDDGGALMVLRIRDKTGGTYWAGGSWRAADGSIRPLAPDAITFHPLRHWRSPHTGTDYPVAMRVQAGGLHLDLAPLMDDQELDSRATTGAVYWEGAVTAHSAGRTIGRGYLELTGYAGRLVY
ncbi:lipocalin-like domain-containing protein [Crenobacter sp. SG2305]|uniref:lipocalin-like domain-containing protein n=1 Tax=Crenobacter oryzisoli TaxID=3056844 RepID=UPI0025AB0C7F|nr:lipocalin-like domain-containing protein [Crenobacter sp. SG2305]MDN0083626.1 lipocalin-like domain-containing protein [Crenobacter sp. SG2305]